MKDRDLSFLLVCSRGMAGTLTPEVLDARPDENGTLFKDAAQHAGYGASSHKVKRCIPASSETLSFLVCKLLLQILRTCIAQE